MVYAGDACCVIGPRTRDTCDTGPVPGTILSRPIGATLSGRDPVTGVRGIGIATITVIGRVNVTDEVITGDASRRVQITVGQDAGIDQCDDDTG